MEAVAVHAEVWLQDSCEVLSGKLFYGSAYLGYSN